MLRRNARPDPLNTAAAHKLAQLIYTMLIKGQEYTDQGQAYDQERYRERVLRQLRLRANKLGMQLVAYGRTADRPEALRIAYRECGITMTTMAKELQLSVSHISRLIAAAEAVEGGLEARPDPVLP